MGQSLGMMRRHAAAGGITPPTYVTGAATAWDTTTTPKTLSITTQVGDRIVAIAMGSNWSNPGSDLTIAGGSLTWDLEAGTSTNSFSQHQVWTATATAATTFDIEVANPGGSTQWGFRFEQWRDSDGFGASQIATNANGAPTVSITTLHDNSALVFSNTDWVPRDGSTRAYDAVNGAAPTERVYFRDGNVGAFYIATYADAGAAGSKAPGINTPGSQKYVAIAVEIRGAA